MNKKGDLSINIIIIAAIALIILVIITVLLFRSGSNITEGTSCQGIGGTCTDSCAQLSEDTGLNYVRHPTAGCPRDGPGICCIRQ